MQIRNPQFARNLHLLSVTIDAHGSHITFALKKVNEFPITTAKVEHFRALGRREQGLNDLRKTSSLPDERPASEFGEG